MCKVQSVCDKLGCVRQVLHPYFRYWTSLLSMTLSVYSKAHQIFHHADSISKVSSLSRRTTDENLQPRHSAANQSPCHPLTHSNLTPPTLFHHVSPSCVASDLSKTSNEGDKCMILLHPDPVSALTQNPRIVLRPKNSTSFVRASSFLYVSTASPKQTL